MNKNRLVSAANNSIIPIKATGNLGSEFFNSNYEPPRVHSSLQLLKQKERHKELREKGYLVDEEFPKEIPMDIPFYEILDPPNQNYRQIFHPNDLTPMIAYNYHSPEFDQNEIFLVSKEDMDQAENLIQQAQNAQRRKEARLYQLNMQYKLEKEKEAEKLKRQLQNDAIETVKKEKKINNKLKTQLPISSPSKEIQNKKKQQKTVQQVINQNDSTKKKTVTFAEEDEIKYFPKNWKQESQDLRIKMQKDRKVKQKYQ